MEAYRVRVTGVERRVSRARLGWRELVRFFFVSGFKISWGVKTDTHLNARGNTDRARGSFQFFSIMVDSQVLATLFSSAYDGNLATVKSIVKEGLVPADTPDLKVCSTDMFFRCKCNPSIMHDQLFERTFILPFMLPQVENSGDATVHVWALPSAACLALGDCQQNVGYTDCVRHAYPS